MASAAHNPPVELEVWAPQPGPQTDLISCPIFEVLYGGARGGGKTDGVLGEWAIHAGKYGQRASGLMVRRTLVELSDTIERSKVLYFPLRAIYSESDKLWRFPNGARLKFAYLERDADAAGYQGHSYTRVYVEEIGNFPSPEPIMKLMATLRSSSGVPCRFRATANPGGPGHAWVKSRYIDPAPTGDSITTDAISGLQRVFIPAKVSDNAALMRNDPDYVQRLKASGSPELVRAWLDGDWNVISGAFFPEFSLVRHVIRPFEVPAHWSRIRAMDWGSARPFCVGWYAVSDGSMDGIERGALVKYREWYGMADQHNKGLKLTAEEVAIGIRQRESEHIEDAVLDPAAFSQDGGPSIAERMLTQKVHFRPADNKRVARAGALGGWDQLRSRLKGFDGPMILFFSTCAHTIRTLPSLQHDPLKAEDLDTEAEDHAADETRYACMSRPITHDAPGQPAPVFPIQRTFNELVKAQTRRRLQEA